MSAARHHIIEHLRTNFRRRNEFGLRLIYASPIIAASSTFLGGFAVAIKDDFEKAQADVKTLKEKPDNSTLLELYALYKQGTEGDATGRRPGIMDPVGRAKFDAWAGKKGTSNDDAMKGYIALVKKLLG
jgi:diazepam-binding inhibitor (GABA receptor modulator, acyl-CoA-binding protein)